MADIRAAKRSRVTQACEPCRGKKSRCPGEKPFCSHCVRLKQACFYADESTKTGEILSPKMPAAGTERAERLEDATADKSSIMNRLKTVEARLAEVISNQESQSRSCSRHISTTPQVEEARPLQQSKLLRPSNDLIAAAGEVYLQYCDCQPLPLFHRGNFMSSLQHREPEVLAAILALVSRYLYETSPQGGEDDYAEASRSVVMKRVSDGQVELSTLQCLCLLSLVDFTNGNTQRASMHASLAIGITFSSGLISETAQISSEVDLEERRRCFWSLMLINRLHGAGFGVLDLSNEEGFPWYPESSNPGQFASDAPVNTSRQYVFEQGIVSPAIQLSEIWFKITRYARRRGKPAKLPPWSPQSEYAIIMAEQMESETRMPQKHRFKQAQFSKRSVDELNADRPYWAPWIFVQFLYHTNLCLLNHPLLTSLRLRNFKTEIPEIFLQSTFDLISSHASWVLNLIGMLEAKSFKVTDPFLAHCASIVATIYLQESFVEDDRADKLASFGKCLQFVQTFIQWPHVMRMAKKLERLRDTVSSAYGNDPNRGLLFDLSQFWEILEYSSSSEISGSLLLGHSLQLGLRSRNNEISHTPSLPQPTRVHTQDFAGGLSCIHIDTYSMPLLYSDDEMAVLAESFFQRPEDGAGDEWWNINNL